MKITNEEVKRMIEMTRAYTGVTPNMIATPHGVFKLFERRKTRSKRPRVVTVLVDIERRITCLN